MLNVAYKKQLIEKKRIGLILKIMAYIFLSFVFFVLNCTHIHHININPFSNALLIALLFCGINNYYIFLSYGIGAIISNFSIENIYVILNSLFVAFIILLINKKIRKTQHISFSFVYYLFSSVALIYNNFINVKSLLSISIALILGMLFLYCAICLLWATIVRGFNFKLNLDEKICGAVILIVFSMGLSYLNVLGIETVKIFVTLAVLICTYLFNANVTVCVGAIIGVGCALFNYNPAYIASFVCFSLLSSAFKSNLKIFSVIAIILCEAIFGLYFNQYTFFQITSIISVGLGGVIFLILPKKLLSYIGDLFGSTKEKVAIRNVVNRSKEKICNRMYEIENVFNEMTCVFKNMIKGNLPKNEAKQMISDELVQKICSKCPEKNKCLRVNGKYTTQVFDDLVTAGFERSKVTLLDVSQYLSSRCGQLNNIIITLNQLLSSYKNYVNMVNNMDSSKVLIADNLNGVGNILHNLAKEIDINISFDMVSENKIIEDLSYKDILCVEAIVYEQNTSEKNVTLLIKSNCVKESVIEKCVSKICKTPMQIISIEASEVPNTSIVNLQTKVLNDIVFGTSTCSKSGVLSSGDTHSLIKLDNSRIMIALCDGMGSGDGAYQNSSLTISLIENFYKAGFDNEIILSSVNKLLSLSQDEQFSALDICVVDIREKVCDFIKLGAPNGFIKHNDGIEVIESSGLPIGILEEIKPHITKQYLNDFDTIILVTDGITDAFHGREDLQTFINNIDSTNPQTMADEIVDRAIDLSNGVCSDDMTVICVKIFPLS